MNRSTGYGVGAPKETLAPIPFETNKTLSTTNYAFPLGQIAYERANDQWVIYQGDGVWTPFTGVQAGIQTLTGNSGGEIQPTAGGTINLIGDGTLINVVGTTNTLTITPSSAIPIKFNGDTGNATPVSNTLALVGSSSTGTSTSATGDTVTLANTFVNYSAPNLSLATPGGGTTAATIDSSGNFYAPVTCRTPIPSITYSGQYYQYTDFATISTPADGTYAIAATSGNNTMAGYITLQWVGTSRTHTVTIFVDTHLAETTAALNIVSNNSFSGQDVITNIKILQQNSDTAQFLVCDIGNRNGSTGPLYVSWLGNGAAKPVLAPVLGANTAATFYGFQQGSNQSGTWYANSASVMQYNASGILTYPLQACFSASLSGDTGGVTGAGTAYTIICNTETYDQGSNYNNATGVFTAPADGKYMFFIRLKVGVLTGANTSGLCGLNGGGNYGMNNPGTIMDSSNFVDEQFTFFQTLTAGATISPFVQIFGGVGDTVIVKSGTTFAGYKIA